MHEHHKKILLVEDDYDIRDAVTVVLEYEGYEVNAVTNGQEALELLHRDSDFCMILLDLMMPVMDGTQFREAQLKDPLLDRIPVVLLSAAHGLKYKAEALHVSGYIPKPPRFDELRGVVDSLC